MNRIAGVAGVFAVGLLCVVMGLVAVIYGSWVDEKLIRIVLLPAFLVLAFLFFADKTKLFLLIILVRAAIDFGIDETRIGPLSIGAAMNGLVILIALLFFIERPRTISRIVIPMWLPVMVVMLFAALRAPDPGSGFRTFLSYSTNVAVFAVPFYLKQCQKDMRFSIWLVLLSSVIPAFYGFVDFARGGSGGEYGDRIQSTFPHPNIFAFYIVVMISMAFYAVKSPLMKTTAVQRWLLVAYIGVLLVDLVLTKTRSAWAACAMVFVVYGVFFERKYLLYLAVASVGALSIPAIQDRLLDLNTAQVYWTSNAPQNSYEWRKGMWEAAWHWIKLSELPLGYGLESFKFHSVQFYRWSVAGGSGAHNVYVQWLFEAGVVGVLCAAWLYYRLFAMLRLGMQYDKLGTVIVITVVVEYLVVAYSDNMLAYLAFNWYYWFVLGSACSIVAARQAQAPTVAGPLGPRKDVTGQLAPAHSFAANRVSDNQRGKGLAWVVVLALGAMQLAFSPVPALAQSAVAKPADALPSDSVFAPTSFWYTPIPSNAPLHANSAAFVQDFIRQKKAFYGTVTINLASWASPVYVVGKDVVPVRVAQWLCNQPARDTGLAQQWAEVPIPVHALPAGGTDAEMTIYQPATDSVWEFWQMRKTDGQWQACWGGKMQNASKGDGAWPGHYGTTATGLPFLGGQITAEELRRGEIRHAIGIALVETETFSVVSWPAKRSDGWNPNNVPNRIPEGLRFRLDPTVDVDALKMHPVGKTIAKAAQKYGFIVWDKAGALSLRAQSPRSYTATGQADPYTALLGGTQPYAVLEGFPWEKLQFLPKDYGKP
jgi:O-antigen ligase